MQQKSEIEKKLDTLKNQPNLSLKIKTAKALCNALTSDTPDDELQKVLAHLNRLNQDI